MSVPISTPLDASFAITPIPPRSARSTPAQYTTMITTAVKTPFAARLGLITYASVLATNDSRVG